MRAKLCSRGTFQSWRVLLARAQRIIARQFKKKYIYKIRNDEEEELERQT